MFNYVYLCSIMIEHDQFWSNMLILKMFMHFHEIYIDLYGFNGLMNFVSILKDFINFFLNFKRF